MSRLALIVVCFSLWIGSTAQGLEPTTNWPRFRGPEGTGQSSAKDLPTKWSASDVAWHVDLPVVGHSSPIVWGDKIFVTGTSQNGGAVNRHVVCVSRKDGKVLWNKVAAKGDGEQLHKMNSWATPSCATDGQRVVAFFGDGGLHCFDVDGEPMWSRDLGTFPGGWGVAASPVIIDSMVIQNCDATGDSYLLAVDKNTGKDVWRTSRREKPKGGWSTPILIDTDGSQQLVLNGEFGVQAYHPKSGKPIWFCKSFIGRGTPAPAWGNGLLYVVNGKSGDVYAVKPDGTGDVTSTRMAWHTGRKGGRDLPSPILASDALVVVGMNGIATGYDPAGGRELWKERLGGNFSGSPIAANGFIYIASEAGIVSVFKAGKTLEMVAQNDSGVSSDEVVRSSLAIHNGQLLLRSDKRLYCIGK